MVQSPDPLHILQPYPAYKSSRVEWLGEVPEHWEVRRLTKVARIINGATPSTNEPKFWNGSIAWLTPDDLGRAASRYIHQGARSITDDGYMACGTRLAPAGSIAISTRAPIGHLAILEGDACVNQGCHLLTPDEIINPTFLYFILLTTRPFVQSLGQGSTFTELSRTTLSDFRVPLPPLPEQQAIVRYLDAADAKIQAYIRAKQRLIVLLEEERKALINQAVTRGLDPNVKLKHSGVEWLGEVPEHWEVRRLKQVCSRSALYGANIKAAYYEKQGVRFLRTTDITDDGHLCNDGVYVPADMVSEYLLTDGDLLLSRSGTVGRSFLYSAKLHGNCAYAGYLVRFTPNTAILPYYLFFLTKSDPFAAFVGIMTISSTIQNLNAEKFANMHIPLPPTPEQQAIVKHLDKATAGIDAAIARTQRQIDLVEEYRTRLIADVVTGQLDVRDSSQWLAGLQIA